MCRANYGAVDFSFLVMEVQLLSVSGLAFIVVLNWSEALRNIDAGCIVYS